jgi:hypothetical protein
MKKDIHGIINAVVQIINMVAIASYAPKCFSDRALIEV